MPIFRSSQWTPFRLRAAFMPCRHIGWLAASSLRALKVRFGNVSLFHQLGISPHRTMSPTVPAPSDWYTKGYGHGRANIEALRQPLPVVRESVKLLGESSWTGGYIASAHGQGKQSLQETSWPNYSPSNLNIDSEDPFVYETGALVNFFENCS